MSLAYLNLVKFLLKSPAISSASCSASRMGFLFAPLESDAHYEALEAHAAQLCPPFRQLICLDFRIRVIIMSYFRVLSWLVKSKFAIMQMASHTNLLRI